MAGITVPIDGDLSPILKTFGELPGRTQAEMAAVGAAIEKEARAGRIAKGFAEIEGVSAASAKRAANKLIREMDRAAAESQKSLQELKKGASVVFGGIVGDIEDLAGAIGEMGPAAAAAVGALGGLAIGAAIVAGVVELERAAGEAVKRLDDLSIPLDPALRDSVEAANASLDALYIVLDEVTVQLAASLGPSVVEATGYVGAFALEFADLVAEALKTQTAIEYFTTYLGSTFIQGLATPVTLLADLAERIGDVGELAGFQGNVLKETGQAWDDYTWSLAKGTKQAANFVELASSGTAVIDDFNGVLVDSTDRYGALADAARRAKQEKQAHEKAAKAAAKAEREAEKVREEQQKAEMSGASAWIKQQEALNRQEEQRVRNIQESEQAGRDAYEAALAQERERAAAEKERAAARLEQIAAEKAAQSDYWIATATAGISAAATLAQAVSDGAAEGSAAQRDAAMVAFRINQAGAIASIGVNAAEAASKAIALFGPPPSPLGIAGIVAATAIGITQAAAVAAQPPPSFHTGGVIASQPLAPDETMIRARKGEEIRTRQEQSGGAGVTVQVVYQHRVFDTFVADNLKQTGSPLRREIGSSSGRLLGHRERAR